MDRLDLGGLDETEFEEWLFMPQLFSRSTSVILRMTISLRTRELADLPWRRRARGQLEGWTALGSIRFQPECQFALRRSRSPDSAGISVRFGPEYAASSLMPLAGRALPRQLKCSHAVRLGPPNMLWCDGFATSRCCGPDPEH